MEDKIVSAALYKVVKVEKWLRQSDFWGLAKISQSTISGYIKNRSIPTVEYRESVVETIREKLNFRYGKDYTTEDVLEIGRKYLAETEGLQESNVRRQDFPRTQHYNIVDSFQQAELAEAINQKMLELEKVDPDALKEVDSFVEYELYKRRNQKSTNQGNSKTA